MRTQRHVAPIVSFALALSVGGIGIAQASSHPSAHAAKKGKGKRKNHVLSVDYKTSPVSVVDEPSANTVEFADEAKLVGRPFGNRKAHLDEDSLVTYNQPQPSSGLQRHGAHHLQGGLLQRSRWRVQGLLRLHARLERQPNGSHQRCDHRRRRHVQGRHGQLPGAGSRRLPPRERPVQGALAGFDPLLGLVDLFDRKPGLQPRGEAARDLGGPAAQGRPRPDGVLAEVDGTGPLGTDYVLGERNRFRPGRSSVAATLDPGPQIKNLREAELDRAPCCIGLHRTHHCVRSLHRGRFSQTRGGGWRSEPVAPDSLPIGPRARPASLGRSHPDRC